MLWMLFLELFKTRLEGALSKLLQLKVPLTMAGELEQNDHEGRCPTQIIL